MEIYRSISRSVSSRTKRYLPPRSLARLCRPAACSIISFRTITSRRERERYRLRLCGVCKLCRNTFHVDHRLCLDGLNKRIVVMFDLARFVRALQADFLMNNFNWNNADIVIGLMILYSRSPDARPCDWCPGRWCRHWWRPLIDCVYCDCVACSPWSLC